MAEIALPKVNFSDLDDSGPAGPYLKCLDEIGLRLLCLAVIRQGVMDARTSDEQGLHAQIWLSETPRWWLKALGISRAWGDNAVYQMIYGGGCPQKQLGLEEEEGEDG